MLSLWKIWCLGIPYFPIKMNKSPWILGRPLSPITRSGDMAWMEGLQGWTLLIALVVHLTLFSQTSFSSHCCNNQSYMGFDQLHSDETLLCGFVTDYSPCPGFSYAVAYDTYKIPLRTQKCEWSQGLIDIWFPLSFPRQLGLKYISFGSSKSPMGWTTVTL